jgi:hypothetical protein
MTPGAPAHSCSIRSGRWCHPYLLFVSSFSCSPPRLRTISRCPGDAQPLSCGVLPYHAGPGRRASASCVRGIGRDGNISSTGCCVQALRTLLAMSAALDRLVAQLLWSGLSGERSLWMDGGKLHATHVCAS